MLSDDHIRAVPPTVKAKALALAHAYANGDDTQVAKELLYSQARACFAEGAALPRELQFFFSIPQSHAIIPFGMTEQDSALDGIHETGNEEVYGGFEHGRRCASHKKLCAFLNEYVAHLANENHLATPENGKYYTGTLNVTQIMGQKAKRLAELMDPSAPANIIDEQFHQREIESIQKALYFYARAANGHMASGYRNKQGFEKELKSLLNTYVGEVAQKQEIQIPENSSYLPAATVLSVS